MMTPLQAAQALTSHGLSVIPIKADGTKAPACAWAGYQTRIADQDELKHLFSGKCGIAVIGGSVSGNLEILDIESVAPQNELVNLIDEHLPGLLATLPQVVTPTGGRHIFYRCAEIAGNQKLAMSAESKVLIETRGEGGYVLTVTSPPECHPSGKPYTLANGSILETPRITVEQREILLSCCRSFNLLIRDDAPTKHHKPYSGAKRPGDDYNERGDALEVLLKHGWKIDGRRNGSAYLRRPGKEHGISASWNVVAPGKLYVFSSNAAPFEFERACDGFGIFARLECGGNFEEATRKLRALGYGEQPAARLEPRNNPVIDNEAPVVPSLPESPESPENLAGVLGMMTLTEKNVASALETIYGDRFRYCKAWGRWLHWTSARWAVEETDLVYDSIIQMVAARNQEMRPGPAKASFASGAQRIAQAARTFATTTKEWDRDPWLLNKPDGTVDLQTGDSHAHVKTDYVTKCTRVSPSDGPHPIFDMFMRDICLNDQGLIQYHQRSLGACLSGAIQDNFLLFWYGSGQNGKNTFGDLITWILGDYAKVIPIETLISNRSGSHPTTLANLRGLRLAVCSEVSEGSYWDEARVKSLTGDTEISARFMRQDFFEFSRTHKHLVYGNHRPMLRIVDPGMQARLHIVPFKAHFPADAKDPDMRRKLETEAPQILSWLLAGHSQWLEDGYLRKCAAVQKETESYFEAQSTNEAWLAECCIEDHDSREIAKALYVSFKTWKESRGEGVMSQTRWGEWMGQRFDKSLAAGQAEYRGVTLKPRSVLEFRD